MEIQRYQPGQVEQRSLASSNPTATPESFGAGNAALLTEAGKQLNSIATDWTVDLAKGSAKEAYNKASIEFNQATNDIFKENQGDKLGDIPKLVEAKRQEISTKYGAQLGPMSSKLFNGAFNDYYTATRKQVDDQVSVAAQKYQLAQSGALIDNLTQQSATLTDPKEVSKNWMAVQAEVMNQNRNNSPEIAKVAVRGAQDDFYSARVLMQGQTSATAALSELQAQKGEITVQRYNQLYEKYAGAAAQEQLNAKVGQIMTVSPTDEQAIGLAAKEGPEVQKAVLDAVQARRKDRDVAQGKGVAAILDTLVRDPSAPITPGILNGDEIYAVAQIRANQAKGAVSNPSDVADLKQIAVADGDGWREIPQLIAKSGDKVSGKDGMALMNLYSKRLVGVDISKDKKEIITDELIRNRVQKSLGGLPATARNRYNNDFAPVYNQAVDDFAQQQGRQPTQEEKMKIADRLTLQTKGGSLSDIPIFGDFFKNKNRVFNQYNDKSKIPQISISQISEPDRKAARLALWNGFSSQLQQQYKTPDAIPDEEVEKLYSLTLFKNLGG